MPAAALHAQPCAAHLLRQLSTVAQPCGFQYRPNHSAVAPDVPAARPFPAYPVLPVALFLPVPFALTATATAWLPALWPVALRGPAYHPSAE